jgi:hypothetical protein
MTQFGNQLIEEISMFQKLPVSSSKLCVWAFIPYQIKGQELISDYNDNTTRQDLAKVFEKLEIKWKWQPISSFWEDGQTSVGTILHQAGIPFAQLMSEIIAEAFARNSTKSRYMSTTI